jgi:hypothetical protein
MLEWIDCKERLPEKDGDYLVKIYGRTLVRPYNNHHECWDDEDCDDYFTDASGGKITKWANIPE